MNWWMNGARRRLPRNLWLHGLLFRAAAAGDGAERAHAARQRRPEMGSSESLSRQPVAPGAAAENLSIVSPAGLFRALATAVCGTDRRDQEKRLDDVRRYREIFVGYLKGKNIFERFEYITPTPPSAFRTADQLVEARTGGKFKTLAEYDAWADEANGFPGPLPDPLNGHSPRG